MCCIFTCCGWMIDLLQRLWTFTMSCCISSAVCCAFTTASMSGIALGYNYSLAEYIDLKETNVSVYIKRGVFDDEFADDMDWRRSGHMPIGGHIGDKNLRTGPPEDEEISSLRSGRRLDDSIFESDDQNKFEGSLMRLTAKAPHSSVTTKAVTSDLEMSEIMSKYPLGSIDQLKAIQSLINMRKSAEARETTVKGMTPKSTYGFDERYLPHFPAFPDKAGSARRIMPYNVQYNMQTPDNSLRKAVPGADINEPAKWLFPKLPPGPINKMFYEDYDKKITYPSPVTPRLGPVKPTKSKPASLRNRPTLTKKLKEFTEKKVDIMIDKPYIDRDLEEFKERLLLDKFETQDIKREELGAMPKGEPIKSDVEDYDEDIKGLPVRRKRAIKSEQQSKSKLVSMMSSSFDRNTFRREFFDESVAPNENIINVFKGNIFLNKLLEKDNSLQAISMRSLSPLVSFESTENVFDYITRSIHKDFSVLTKLTQPVFI